MKKAFLLNLFVVVSLAFVTSGTSIAQSKSKGITGTWNFKAPDAPYEYSEGSIVIEKKEGSYKFIMAFDENNKLEAYDVKVKGKEITCKLNIQGDVINIKATNKKNNLEGIATYSEGSIAFTATREKKKE